MISIYLNLIRNLFKLKCYEFLILNLLVLLSLVADTELYLLVDMPILLNICHGLVMYGQ